MAHSKLYQSFANEPVYVALKCLVVNNTTFVCASLFSKKLQKNKQENVIYRFNI